MEVDLFAGICVSDYQAALPWDERLLGSEPSFLPHDTEAVWELGEHHYLYIVEAPEHAGHARHTLFAADLDPLVAEIASRGLEPAERVELTPTACARSPSGTATATRSAMGELRLISPRRASRPHH